MARPANPELRDKIVVAASEIIEACGPDCVTMREVAEKIGYSSTTIYLYFKDKGAILREAVLRSFDDLNETCAVAMVGPGPLDKFRQRARAYIMWALTHPGHYTLMFELPWDMSWTVDWIPENVERFTRGRADDIAVMREAIARGDLRADLDVEATEDAAWAALHGVASLAISGRLTASNPNATHAEVLEVAYATADLLVNALIDSGAPE